MAKKIVEGLWDCQYCDTKGIRGRERICPGCGKPRGEGVRFYLPSGGGRSAPAVKLNEREKLPDWQCEYCGSYNPGTANDCLACTAPKEGKDYYQLHQDVKRSDASRNFKDERWKCGFCGATNEKERTACVRCGAERGVVKPAPNQQKTQKKKGFWGKLPVPVWIGIGVLLLILIPILIGAIGKKVRYSVDQKSWLRSIVIEEYKTVEESDWEIPEGGRLLYTREEIHHYEKVLDHYSRLEDEKQIESPAHEEIRNVTAYLSAHNPFRGYVVYADDLGNGYFEIDDGGGWDFGSDDDDSPTPVYRDEPVYRTKYYYEIERWVPTRSVDTTGFVEEEPYWGEVQLSENEREAVRAEAFYLETSDLKKGKQEEIEVTKEQWDQINVGDHIEIYYQFGDISDIRVLD